VHRSIIPPFLIFSVLAGLLLAGCAGSSEPDNAPGPPPAGSTEESASEAAPPQSERSDVEIVEIPAVSSLAPPQGADLLGGTPNYAAGEAALAALDLSAQELLAGGGLMVLPISGTDQSLLVLAFDAITAGPATTDTLGSVESDAALQKLVNLPELSDANVVRVVILAAGNDDQGDYTMTVTIPWDDFAQAISGPDSLSADAFSRMTFDLEYAQ
jgi:hypothetical protein